MLFSPFSDNYSLHTEAVSGSVLLMGSPPSPQEMATLGSDFQFVNISGPADIKSPENRNLVRRSVAASHRRKQVMRRSTAPGQMESCHMCLGATSSSEATPNYCSICGHSLRRKRGELPSNAAETEDAYELPEARSVQLPLLGAGNIDPFATFPISTQPYMYFLVDYCE